jgi:hypothetical protein
MRRIHFIFFLLLLAIHIKTNAQLSGYAVPLSAPGGAFNLSTAFSSTISSKKFLDGTRAQVTSYTVTSSTSVTITLNPSRKYYASGDNLAVKDMVLLVQMTGGYTGVHQNFQIVSISGSGGNTLTLKPVTTPILTTISVGAGSVQMIKVQIFDNLTLNNGAELTCNEFDGYTGGILPMIVKKQLTVNGGRINVSAKGYFNPTVSGGIGGAGGVCSSPSNGLGFAAPIQGYYANPTCSTVTVNQGQNGGTSCKTGVAGTNSTGSNPTLPNRMANTLLVMGKYGDFAAKSSGAGASSGASGGDAASTCAGGSGAAGSCGGNGGNGGNVGKDGRGGGAMVIKVVDRIQINVSYPVFLLDGQDGQAGGNGGNGGTRGAPGLSGNNCCTTPDGPGGEGYGGDIGASGGDGGNGGYPGTGWVVCKTSGASNISGSNVSVANGQGGPGGQGGYAYDNASYTPKTIVDVKNCDGDYCVRTTDPCSDMVDKTVLDCGLDEIMCLFYSSAATIGYNYLSTPDMYFTLDGRGPSPADWNIKYDATAGKVIWKELDPANCATIYHEVKVFNKTNCDKIFSVLGKSTTLYAGLGVIDHTSVTLTGGSCGPVSNPSLRWESEVVPSPYAPATPLLEYRSAEKLLEYQDFNRPKCYVGSCFPNDAPGTQSNDGADGTAPQYTGYAGNITTYNFYYDDGILWKTTGVNQVNMTNQLNVNIFPNPVQQELFIRYSSEGNTEWSIIVADLSGKTLISQKVTAVIGVNTHPVDTKQLSNGFYFVTVSDGQNQTTQKIQIQH